MAPRKILPAIALPFALALASLGLSACSGGGADPDAGSSATSEDSSGTVAQPDDSAEGTGDAADGATIDPLAALIARYAGCEDAGSVLGSAIDGLTLDENSTFTSEEIGCLWSPAEVDSATTVTVVQITAAANAGADDVPAAETIAAIGAVAVPDPAVEAIGGVVYLSTATGDAPAAVTAVDVPGLSLQITQNTLGTTPDLAGETALPAINALLGLS